MSKTTFNSYAEKENYAFIKDEAYREDRTVKVHISNIINAYGESKRKGGTFEATLKRLCKPVV